MNPVSLFRLPRRRADLCPLPPFTPRDRRRSARRQLTFPVRLRLGDEIFWGQARDLSESGIGLWFAPRSDGASALTSALTDHKRGVIEVQGTGGSIVARVHIARSASPRDGTYIGASFGYSAEAERLICWLEAHGLATTPPAGASLAG